jgi:hypothetical protein
MYVVLSYYSILPDSIACYQNFHRELEFFINVSLCTLHRLKDCLVFLNTERVIKHEHAIEVLPMH